MSKTVESGIILALLTAFISGFSIFYNKLVVVKGIDPLVFNIIKNGGVALLLSSLLIGTKYVSELKKLSFPTWLKLVVIGIIGGSIPFVLFFQGLTLTSAVNANLIHKTLFIWVALLALPLLSEKLNRLQICGYLIIFASNFFLGGFNGFSLGKGELLILLATILWSLENIIAKITLIEVTSILVSWGRMFIGSLILLVIAFIPGKLILFSQLSSSQILPISGSILFLTGYVITWYAALKKAPATLVTSILVVATPITNILTVIFITNSFPQIQILNTIGTVIGIMLITIFVSKINKTSPNFSRK